MQAITCSPDLSLMCSAKRQVKPKAGWNQELLWQFDRVLNRRLDLFMPGKDRNPRATHAMDRVVSGGR